MTEEKRPWEAGQEKLLKEFETSLSGLSTAEAERRRQETGPNEVPKDTRRHAIDIFISQFLSPLILVLIAAAAIAYFLEDTEEALIILAIVGVNALLGFFQEYRAERALRELKKYVTKTASVMRDGVLKKINSTEIVPGDIVELVLGDIVPADMRLIAVNEFSANESSLTGESLPVSKGKDSLKVYRPIPQNLTNMAFMGTAVVSGSGRGVVTSVGMETFFGKTAAYLKMENPPGDFEKGIKKFSFFLLRIILIMTLFIFLVNVGLKRDFFMSFLFALALAVGLIPEMLPIITTLSLSAGALRMTKKKVIIKKLASVEDLGNINILCSDKTGTLTEGSICLSDYLDADGKRDSGVLLSALLCNSVRKSAGADLIGNPMDLAIWQSPDAAPIEPTLKNYTTLSKDEFDFERKRMSTLVSSKGKRVLLVKGASEAVLSVCTAAVSKGKRRKLDSKSISALQRKIERFESKGLRVLAVAEKPFRGESSTHEDEHGLTLTGFLLFKDPVKGTAKESLRMLRNLGVSIKIITGDSPIVTRSICAEVGLKIVGGRAILGDELQDMSEQDFARCAETYNVFARVTPEQKYKIVASLSKSGHIVGFLGDGINDTPALRAADVGISVDSAAGIAKEAADVILLEKHLEVIADGITEGRKTFGNILKYILNTNSANFGNMFTVAISSLFLKFIPLLPSQILLNNLVSDLPMFAIATDHVDEALIQKPQRWSITFIQRFMVFFGFISVVFDLLLILPLLLSGRVSMELFRTMWFVESVLSEIIITFSIRTSLPMYRSKPSRALVVLSVLSCLAAVVMPFTAIGQRYLAFVRLPLWAMLFIFAVLIGYIMIAEIVKRRFFTPRNVPAT